MFHPIIIVVAASLGLTAPFSDLRKPGGYPTLAACEARLIEMKTPINRVMAIVGAVTAVEIAASCRRSSAR